MRKSTQDKLMAWSLRWFGEPEKYMNEKAFFHKWGVEVKAREYASEWRRNRVLKNKHIPGFMDNERLKQRQSYAKCAEKHREGARKSRLDRNNDPVRLEKYREYCRNKARERVKNDPEFLARKRLRTRIIMALKRQCTSKSKRTHELIGCTITELRTHIEKQFKPGITWDNWTKYGWHIDHIKPCDSFDLTDIEQQKVCFHYTNLQPLWCKENWSKGNR